MERSTIAARIVGRHSPARSVQLGIQRAKEVIGLVPGDLSEAHFDLTLDLIPEAEGGAGDWRGPYVHGARGARFLYLCWGQVGEDGAFAMSSRAKLPLPALDTAAVARLREPGACLTGTLDLADERGRPVTGSVRLPRLAWSVDSVR